MGNWSNVDYSDYDCSIANIVRGEWYSREKNEDKKTNIDATTMTGRGECKAFRTNYGGEYQYIFAERRGDDYSCHHCVHFFVRTVNIIEKKESKYCCLIMFKLSYSYHRKGKKEVTSAVS